MAQISPQLAFRNKTNIFIQTAILTFAAPLMLDKAALKMKIILGFTSQEILHLGALNLLGVQHNTGLELQKNINISNSKLYLNIIRYTFTYRTYSCGIPQLKMSFLLPLMPQFRLRFKNLLRHIVSGFKRTQKASTITCRNDSLTFHSSDCLACRELCFSFASGYLNSLGGSVLMEAVLPNL